MIHFENFDYSSLEMKNLICEMLNNGFRIITSTNNKKINWFKFSKNNKLGYTQENRSGGFSFSVSYKPSREFGTGWIKFDEIYLPTVKHAEETLRCQYAGIEYKDLNEFIRCEKVLSFIELYSDSELLNQN